MFHDHTVLIMHKLDVLWRTSLTMVFSDGINESQKILSKLEESVFDWTTRLDATWVLMRNR
jgi:hypothetical protein